jgi:uncharacterized protein (TIGR03437 family)
MPSQSALHFLFFGLLATPLLAQPQIGGGTCSSASLSGTYAVSITGRQVSTSGTFTNALQANGSATFDGLSAVTITLTEDTTQAVATSLTWSGTYSVQANCVATANITSGGSATLNVMLYNQGKDFLLTGSDATYSYSGSGVTLPQTTCSTGTLNGVYTFDATGYELTSTSISGVANGAGLLQFDGLGNLTANVTSVISGPSSSAISLKGSYSISSNCLGSATLTDVNSNTFVMSFSIYSDAVASTNFYATLARSSDFLMSGAGHTAYGQPASTTSSVSAHAVSGGTCSTSELSGTYALTVSGRAISAGGSFAGSFQAVGTATFDGQGNVTLAATYNTNVVQGKPFSFTGTYTIPSDCSGTLTFTSSSVATFTLVVWNGGNQFAMVGSDGKYVYSASGNNTQPPACATPTLSGEYTFTASGFTVSGTSQTGSEDEAGVLQFDGQGAVTASYTDTQGGAAPVSYTATGNYVVASCLASATLGDSSGKANALNFVISGAYGQNLDVLAANSQFVRDGSAHSAWNNPTQGIVNVASYTINAAPSGSIFSIFGQNLSTTTAQAVATPLPIELLKTSVTVNGESAPLFYVEPTQINAQMPLDIPGDTVATVVVTNGTSASSAAATYVPATGTPGIATFSDNRAALVNANGTVNTGAAPAAVGDEVAVYFTGGGPVQASGTLTTGAASPAGFSPVTGTNSITVGAIPATVKYVGLTPGSVGLYQANFVVPQIAKGTYPVVITIAGQASNGPVMTVSN